MTGRPKVVVTDFIGELVLKTIEESDALARKAVAAAAQ